MATCADIGERIVAAALERRLAPGAHLAEQQLAELFGCSRTTVREALVALAARGLVCLAPRRGWFVPRPSAQETRDAFHARRALETGILACADHLPEEALLELRDHLQQQRAALAGDDTARRGQLLGDFHVRLARALGPALLADTLRDLTVRTTLAAQDHQDAADAARSCAEHEAIVDALQAGDMLRARRLLDMHLGTWSDKLRLPVPPPDRLAGLRAKLAPTSVPTHHPIEESP